MFISSNLAKLALYRRTRRFANVGLVSCVIEKLIASGCARQRGATIDFFIYDYTERAA